MRRHGGSCAERRPGGLTMRKEMTVRTGLRPLLCRWKAHLVSTLLYLEGVGLHSIAAVRQQYYLSFMYIA